MALLPARNRDKYMLLVIIAALALTYVYYDQLWSPRTEQLDATQAHVDSLLVMNQRAKSELAQGKTAELKAEADRYAQDLDVMRQLVPTGNEVPALLEQVSTAARRVGLDISDVSPQPVLTGDQYDAYKYRLSVRGQYHQIGDLLTNIGSMQRIVSPINLTLAPLPPDPKKPKTAVLDAHFEIQTYVSRTAPTKAGAPLKGGRTGGGQ
jgi:type IV pilus assembly protein PilO